MKSREYIEVNLSLPENLSAELETTALNFGVTPEDLVQIFISQYVATIEPKN